MALLLSSLACKQKSTQNAEPSGYRVMGYDGQTHQWTILRTGTFDGKYLRKRLTVVCTFWQVGERESVKGPEACHLEVGRLLVPYRATPLANPEDFVDVSELADETLSITEGEGDNRVMQQFTILKYEVLPEAETQ